MYFESGQYAKGYWFDDHSDSVIETGNSAKVREKIEEIRRRHEKNKRQSVEQFNETFYEKEESDEKQESEKPRIFEEYSPIFYE